MIKHLTQLLRPENWLSKLKTFEFTNLPPSFFEKTSLIEEFLDKNLNDDCYLDEFDFCIIANETNSGGTQKLIFRNLVVVTLRLIYFFYRNAELSAQNKKLVKTNSEILRFKERNAIMRKMSRSSSGKSVKQRRVANQGFQNQGFQPTPMVKDFCAKVCVELSANDIYRFLFGYLKMSIDDTLKTTIVEILNSMDVTTFKLVQIESIFHLMQEAKDFTKGKNELVYGNLLLILTKFLCCSSYAENFIKNFGSEWVYELFEMLRKNTHRNVIHDANEQREKDILNCCFLHFICNFSTFMELIELDQNKLLNYGHQILKNEICSNPLVSPPLEIEKSFLGDDHKNLISFLHDSKADTLQYFRILNYLASSLDNTQLSKNCFKGNLLVNQKELYYTSFDKVRDILMGELLFFSEGAERNDSSKYQSSRQSKCINHRRPQFPARVRTAAHHPGRGVLCPRPAEPTGGLLRETQVRHGVSLHQVHLPSGLLRNRELDLLGRGALRLLPGLQVPGVRVPEPGAAQEVPVLPAQLEVPLHGGQEAVLGGQGEPARLRRPQEETEADAHRPALGDRVSPLAHQAQDLFEQEALAAVAGNYYFLVVSGVLH